MSLEAALEKLAPIMADAQAQVSPGIHLMLSGGSDDLADTIATMSWNFAFAVLILFLLMTALFRSAVDSLVVHRLDADGPGRRRAGVVRPQPVHLPVAGFVDHDRLRDPHGPGGQQRHTAD